MHVGMTGTQDGCTRQQRENIRRWIIEHASEIETLHQGDCVGADFFVAVQAEMSNIQMVVHPPTFNGKRAHTETFSNVVEVKPPADYLVRNRRIVAATDCLIAIPKGMEALRSGTWSTVRYARKQGKPVTIFWPDGTVTTEREDADAHPAG